MEKREGIGHMDTEFLCEDRFVETQKIMSSHLEGKEGWSLAFGIMLRLGASAYITTKGIKEINEQCNNNAV